MSGKSRTAFHAVPRIIKVGEEHEPPVCLKWQDGLFENDTDMTSEANPVELQESGNQEIPDVQEQTKGRSSHGNCASITTKAEKSELSEKCASEETCNIKIISELEGINVEANERCYCNKLDFCGKFTKMKSLTAEEWRKFEIHLSKTRINVNVRQVHEKGKTMNSFCQ